jgi:hypothetical protein
MGNDPVKPTDTADNNISDEDLDKVVGGDDPIPCPDIEHPLIYSDPDPV